MTVITRAYYTIDLRTDDFKENCPFGEGGATNIVAPLQFKNSLPYNTTVTYPNSQQQQYLPAQLLSASCGSCSLVTCELLRLSSCAIAHKAAEILAFQLNW